MKEFRKLYIFFFILEVVIMIFTIATNPISRESIKVLYELGKQPAFVEINSEETKID
ncbi:MAG: hypothetical protein J6A15_02540 [Clostridia bacterium]|nr:hypothetical protein [Clostridia bacterium]